jgi:glucans biosynthesis protein
MPTSPCRVLLAALALLIAGPVQAFSFQDVARRAQALAERGYEKPDNRLPKDLADLGYDQYRDIRFNPARALWRSARLPFELQFFHPGLYYNQPVRIHQITGQGVTPVRFNPDYFNYGRINVDRSKLRDLGYPGFRAHYRLNNRGYKDELVVFLGASYFRALGKDQRYGLSARALAVDTGLMSGEEFPHFTEFWVRAPGPRDTSLAIYALLDSPRVTGAYQFTLRPGDSTQMDIKSRIYLREPVGKLGLAPLTSMYLFGENQPPRHSDYRPEVHDSDGLLVQTEKEWLWRPLSNPRRLLITSFSAVDPKGYGLMQRDRNFAHYEDLEARYELRPSAWVVPRGRWGAGRVELVQIPSPDETNDNIVAFWVPDQLPDPRKPLDLEYSLLWEKNRETRPLGLARVVQTRYGHGFVRDEDDSLRFHIDFEGGALAKLPAATKLIAGIWVGDNGELLERQTHRNEVTGGWRLSLRVKREDAEKPVEMRAFLRNEADTVSETWSYILPGEPR